MKIKVNPTRMELIRLKRRLVISKRSHKLLKDKMDELIRVFMERIDEARELRKKIENNLKDASGTFREALGRTPKNWLVKYLKQTPGDFSIKSEKARVFNLVVPDIKAQGSLKKGESAFETTPHLDKALEAYRENMADLLKLASLEKTLAMLAVEIETTRRRVNALEYILIPAIEETIKYISTRLEELERESIIRLMRLK